LLIGERNIALAEELLSIHRIPIVAKDLGGSRGLKIIFNTKSGIVLAGRLTAKPSTRA
jgi:chemotaxis receptor (MCP) glutamine deamidase CheD